METNTIFAWLLVIITTAITPAVNGKYNSGSHIINVPTTIKETHLHFFMHDTLSGDNPSTILVAKPSNTVVQAGNTLPFGAVYVFDDSLTEELEVTSKVIGNARGMYASVSRGMDVSLLFSGDLELTSGEFNGSSITVVCRDGPTVVKEMAVVGGRGKFRMAKGFTWINAVYVNATSGDAILEWNVTVFHQ
ncbi:hypothetical protein QVD17_18258 [Tagetes erecta]|uniref:Dirigent protein n=1 Tax=Tagetes erecta TaxID=13708 RepID=A0AAD8KKU0_TARER|nr:hypothetical protein QVD17_18258 [Tagetes erecta]